jgi:FG-GAP-like repeat
VTILLGNGDGTFRNGGAPGVFLPGPIVVDDFDGDGISDLAQFASRRVSVVLGRGDGSFHALPISSAVGSGPDFVGNPIAVSDFNNDGHKDVVVTSPHVSGVPVGEGKPNELGVSILLGYGDGTFKGTWNYDLGTGTFAALSTQTVARGEFNRDGIQDLVVAIPGFPVESRYSWAMEMDHFAGHSISRKATMAAWLSVNSMAMGFRISCRRFRAVATITGW